jgi:amidase
MSQRPPAPRPNRRRPQRRAGLTRREVISTIAGASAAVAVGVVAWEAGVGDAVRDAKEPSPTPTSAPTVVPTAEVTAEVTQAPTIVTGTPAAITQGVDVSGFLEEVSVAELRRALDSGAFTAEQLTQASLDRIAAMDRSGPALGAVIETNPEAIAIARQLDAELAAGQRRGPLHGIPVLIKDSFATQDQMRTGAGSMALAQNSVVRDAFVVSRLRDAGAVILGKTNLTEFSNFKGGGAAGWSARGGQTRNPYVVTHSPWGSSSGSAVAVSASYVPLAIGSETDGSILCPAAACGIVGMKPTVGLVSRRGAVPISFTQDSPGPMGRGVEDVAILLSAMAGEDPEDAAFGEMASYAPPARFATPPVPAAGSVDYTTALDPDGLRGARIGVCRSLFGFDPNADALAEEAIAAMREAGAEIVDEIYIGAIESLLPENEYLVLLTEFAHGIQQFLAEYMPEGPVASLQDIVTYNAEHADEELAYGDQLVLEAALSAGTIWDDFYLETLQQNLATARDEGIDWAMDEYQVDALVAPTAGLPTLLDPYDDGFTGSSSQLAAMAGYPSITVPIGLYNAMPVGLHLFGRAFSEETLLRLAYGLERALPGREAPRYLEEPPLGDNTPVPGEDYSGEEIPWDDTGELWQPDDSSDGTDGEWAPVEDDSSEEAMPPDEGGQ